MTDIDMMVKTVVSRRKMDSIISSDDGVIDGFGFKIEGTITYEIRHDYIPAKDGDDA